MTSIDSILKLIIQRSQECLAHPSMSTLSGSLASQCSPPQLNITLPDAPSLQPALMAAGAHPEISLAMDQVYQKRAADLRTLCYRSITNVCSTQYPSRFRLVPKQKILSVFTELYLKQLANWRECVVSSYLKRSSAGDKTQTSSSAPKFNHVSPIFYHFLIQLFMTPLVTS